jgi:hypothetical protein
MDENARRIEDDRATAADVARLRAADADRKDGNVVSKGRDESSKPLKELGHGLPPGRTSVEILARAKYEQRARLREGTDDMPPWSELVAPMPPEPENGAPNSKHVAYERAATLTRLGARWVRLIEKERVRVATAIVAQGGDAKAAVETADELLAILYTT